MIRYEEFSKNELECICFEYGVTKVDLRRMMERKDIIFFKSDEDFEEYENDPEFADEYNVMEICGYTVIDYTC